MNDEENVAVNLRGVSSVAMELADAAQYTPEMTALEVLEPMARAWGTDHMQKVGETAHAIGVLVDELLDAVPEAD